MDEESVGSGGVAVTGSGPEKGPAGVVTRVRKVVQRSLEEAEYMLVIQEVAKGLKLGRLPDMKFMMDFLKRLQAAEEVPQEEYDSFAAVLWKELQRLEAEEQGTGNRE
jgi:hypothetical protein